MRGDDALFIACVKGIPNQTSVVWLPAVQVRLQELDEQLEALAEEQRQEEQLDTSRQQQGGTQRTAQQPEHGAASSGGGRWRPCDEAVSYLRTCPELRRTDGAPFGRVMGRLCDVLQLRPGASTGPGTSTAAANQLGTESTAAVAVNAVLSEQCQLASCLVVTDRRAAEQVGAGRVAGRMGNNVL